MTVPFTFSTLNSLGFVLLVEVSIIVFVHFLRGNNWVRNRGHGFWLKITFYSFVHLPRHLVEIFFKSAIDSAKSSPSSLSVNCGSTWKP